MENQRIDFYLKVLAELSTDLVKLKHLNAELDQKVKISDAVEQYLDGFTFSKASPMQRNVDSKLNKLKVQNQQPWSAKELQEMPYLKDLKYRITRDGIHQFRYRRDGFNVSFNSKKYEVAKKKARDFIDELKKTLRKESDVPSKNTLHYVAGFWFSLKRIHSDPSTWRAYESVYKNHIEPVFGKRSIKALLPIELQPFFDNLFQKSGRLCEYAKTILNGIFEYAIANRMIPSNPMGGVYTAKHVRKTGKVLSDEQLHRFNVKMMASGSYGLAAIIILYTGIRGAELESLTFNWDAGTFSVKNAKLKVGQKMHKENLYRTVPIFPKLYELRHLIEECDSWHIEAKKLSNEFSAYWTENTVKDLRHTFISRARESGIENELVNLWTGHLPGNNVTANIYTHFSMEYQQKEAKKLQPY